MTSKKIVPLPGAVGPDDRQPDKVVIRDAMHRINMLLASHMQGDQSAESVLNQINEIMEEQSLCDAAGIEPVQVGRPLA